MSIQKKRDMNTPSGPIEKTKKKPRSKRSYLQLKVNISETMPTGAVILEALLSNDPEFFKQYGLSPKVTRANKLLWFAYLGITQGGMPGSERVMALSATENIHPNSGFEMTQDRRLNTQQLIPPSQTASHSELPKPTLQVTKADQNEKEEDALDEGALMAGLID